MHTGSLRWRHQRQKIIVPRLTLRESRCVGDQRLSGLPTQYFWAARHCYQAIVPFLGSIEIAAIEEPAAIQRILTHLGLAAPGCHARTGAAGGSVAGRPIPCANGYSHSHIESMLVIRILVREILRRRHGFLSISVTRLGTNVSHMNSLFFAQLTAAGRPANSD